MDISLSSPSLPVSHCWCQGYSCQSIWRYSFQYWLIRAHQAGPMDYYASSMPWSILSPSSSSFASLKPLPRSQLAEGAACWALWPVCGVNWLPDRSPFHILLTWPSSSMSTIFPTLHHRLTFQKSISKGHSVLGNMTSMWGQLATWLTPPSTFSLPLTAHSPCVCRQSQKLCRLMLLTHHKWVIDTPCSSSFLTSPSRRDSSLFRSCKPLILHLIASS